MVNGVLPLAAASLAVAYRWNVVPSLQATQHPLLGWWAIQIALIFHIAVGLTFLGTWAWIHYKSHPLRLPLAWALEARRLFWHCFPFLVGSILCLSLTWVSGNALLERLSVHTPKDYQQLHYLFHGTLAVVTLIVNGVAGWRYYSTAEELAQLVEHLRGELAKVSSR